jgi:hypothetical protein
MKDHSKDWKSEKYIPNKGKMVYVRAKKTQPYQGGIWDSKIKQKALKDYLKGDSLKIISREMNIPYPTLRQWQASEWWREAVKEEQETNNQLLDYQITGILHKSLEAVNDRLEEGEYVRDEKTGKIVRVPVKMRDANAAFNQLMEKRQLIRKLPTAITDNTSVNTQLKMLADQFKTFVNKSVTEPPTMEHVIEGDHVIINEDGTGEWVQDDTEQQQH